MHFSLLVPTRARPLLVKGLLDSLLNTVSNIKEIEIIFVADEDDNISKENFKQISETEKYKNLNIKVFYRERSMMLNKDYYCYAGDRASGELLWVVGDDVQFLIKNWDNIIWNKINDYLKDKLDRIVCAGIKDTTPKPNLKLPQFVCFPIITKEAFKATGFVLHPFLPNWGADYLIYLLYVGVNRYLPINDTDYLHHISWHTRSVEKDATAIELEKNFNQYKMRQDLNIDWNRDNTIPNQIIELQNYINNFGKGINV